MSRDARLLRQKSAEVAVGVWRRSDRDHHHDHGARDEGPARWRPGNAHASRSGVHELRAELRHVGIYWNKHHDRPHMSARVTGSILWADPHLPFLGCRSSRLLPAGWGRITFRPDLPRSTEVSCWRRPSHTGFLSRPSLTLKARGRHQRPPLAAIGRGTSRLSCLRPLSFRRSPDPGLRP